MFQAIASRDTRILSLPRLWVACFRAFVLMRTCRTSVAPGQDGHNAFLLACKAGGASMPFLQFLLSMGVETHACDKVNLLSFARFVTRVGVCSHRATDGRK